MSDAPQPAVPPLMPPRLEVGYNYTWSFNRYGTHIGPRDIENDPPTGANDAMPVWRDAVAHPPAGSLARNLKILRDELKITKVRTFLLCNAFNYGSRPLTGATPSGKSIFTAPATTHPLFVEHFKQMMEGFIPTDMLIIPSVIDLRAFYPLIAKTAGGGRTSILTSQRKAFIDRVVLPLVSVSATSELRKAIFAWEVVNEPKWNVIAAPIIGRPHTSSSGPDVDEGVMAGFIEACLAVFHSQEFPSTVGDLKGPMPTGNMPQYHYYGRTGLAQQLVGVNDPDPVPSFRDANTAFVGELAVAPGGAKNQFGDEEPGEPWPKADCGGRDTTR